MVLYLAIPGAVADSPELYEADSQGKNTLLMAILNNGFLYA